MLGVKDAKGLWIKMSYNTDKIVIVGGGSAGWMTAATLIKSFPNKKIFVIESENIPTIGVGESTLIDFNEWLDYLEINKTEVLRASEGSYKLGISFKDFADLGGDTRIYTFGEPDFNECRNKYEDWYVIKQKNPEIPFSDYTDYYFKHSYSIKTNKIPVEKNDYLEPFIFERDTAFQINAVKFASWLRDNYCIPKGVVKISADVKSIKEYEGGIESLYLSNGETISSDLFIDCTGFKSILLGQVMKPKFIHTKEYLPNNKAWFGPYSYKNPDLELELSTICTGVTNGWIWQTPLWSRMGSGYVYSDEDIDDDSALNEFKSFLDSEKMKVFNPNRSQEMDFKKIEIKNGYYETPWVKNVVAIGLSHGFLEPMESTGLMFIHLAAMFLVKVLSRSKYTTWDSDRFNNLIGWAYKESFSFVSAHYALSLRDDTPYWNRLTSLNYDNYIHESVKNAFNFNVSQVYVGWGHLERTSLNFHHRSRVSGKNYMDIDSYEKVRRYKIKKANEFIDSCPTHYEYLRTMVHNEY